MKKTKFETKLENIIGHRAEVFFQHNDGWIYRFPEQIFYLLGCNKIDALKEAKRLNKELEPKDYLTVKELDDFKNKRL